MTRRPSKRALRKLNAEALAKVARLSRQVDELPALRWERDAALDELEACRDAIRELRGRLLAATAFNAAERAMPLPSEGDAA